MSARRDRLDPVIPRPVAVVDAVAAAAVSGIGVLLVLGEVPPVAVAGMLMVGLPLLLRRRHPVLAMSLFVVAGVWLNGILFGAEVRCGAQLPAAAYLMFAVSRRPRRHRWPVVALLLVAFLAGEAAFDPVMQQWGGLWVATVVAGGGVLAGEVVRRRDVRVERLRLATIALHDEREQSERTAADAERLRIGVDVVSSIEEQLETVRENLHAARRLLVDGDAAPAFRTIEEAGRRGLADMRHTLGRLHGGEVTVGDEPSLGMLRGLLTGLGQPDALRTQGDPEAVAVVLRLTAYGLVEQILTTIDGARGPVDVRIGFGSAGVDLRVEGPRTPEPAAAVMEAVRTRVALCGGTVTITSNRRSMRVQSRLPSTLHEA
jgi:signal transduction histidine kinase